MDRTLTRNLLANSNIESTTPGNSDNDWFGRWAMPEVHGACAAPTDSELAAREVVESTRSVIGRLRRNATETMCLSYSDLKEGGCLSREFQYVPDNGVYDAFKAALRIYQGKLHRRQFGRCGNTRSTRGSNCGGAAPCDDQISELTPRQGINAFRQQGTSRSSCNDSDLTRQEITVALHSHYQLRCDNRDKDAALSRGRRSSEAKSTCSGDVHSADEIRAKQEQQCSDNRRRVKTWLYNFLPPIETAQLGHGDADPPQESLAEARDRVLLPPKSRIVSGRGRGGGWYPSGGGSGSRRLRGQLNDVDLHETTTTRRRRRQLKSAASDDVVRSRQTADVEERRRRRSVGITNDDCQVYFTETCLLPRCDCPHHHEHYSDHEDAPRLTSCIDENCDEDWVDISDAGSIDATAADDVDADDETEKEATKSPVQCFNSELQVGQASDQLHLSLTGRVIDMHVRHEESCKS